MTTSTLHPFFETLGAGPYRFLYCYDLGAALNPDTAANFGSMRGWAKEAPKLKAGLGTCAHCGMAISLICVVRTGNGDLYGVGSDCVAKCDHNGSYKGAKAAIALRRAEIAREKNRLERLAQWEAGRGEREAREAAARAEWQAERAKRHAATLARFDRHLGIIEWLLNPALAAEWRRCYEGQHPSYCGDWAEFSAPHDPSSFHQSLALQLIQRGTLSSRQAECVARDICGRSKSQQEARDRIITQLTNP